MIFHDTITPEKTRSLIKSNTITLAGNRKLKIYGTLHCKSGKRMKKANRVFFEDEKAAIIAGYRPCGHCMKKQYLIWMNSK
ncbi:MAG: Ada metal-binding domain-containing protein [Ferruginibacter sp.]